MGGALGISNRGPLAITGLMGTSTVEQLLENVCLLLASRTRDVVKSALGFIKVAVVVMDVTHLAKHVQLVVSTHLPLGGNVASKLYRGTNELQGQKISTYFNYMLPCATKGHAGALEGTSRGTATWRKWKRVVVLHVTRLGPSTEARALAGQMPVGRATPHFIDEETEARDFPRSQCY